MKHSNLGAVAAFLFALALAWVGGYDFNERGMTSVMVILQAVLAATSVKICTVLWETIR